jgi:hypothetical protein
VSHERYRDGEAQGEETYQPSAWRIGLNGGSEGKTHGISVKLLSMELKTVANEVGCCASFIFPPRMTALFAKEAVANL